METRASYVLVGIFVLALAGAGFGVVAWLARVEFEAAPRAYRIYFDGSVTGLSVGSPVRYRGVPVGSVARIRIDRRNVERIEVVIEIDAGTPIKTDTVATLGLQGVTGLAYVLLSGGTQAAPPLAAASGEEIAEIGSKPSGLEQLFDKAPELFDRAVALVDRLSRLVDDRNQAALTDTLDSLRRLSGSLAGGGEGLDALLGDARLTMEAIRKTAVDMNRLGETLRARSGSLAEGTLGLFSDVRSTLEDIRGTAKAIHEIADRVDVVVAENSGPLRDFSNSGLYEMSQFVAEARVLVANLTRLSARIERDPARFLLGDSQQGFEAE